MIFKICSFDGTSGANNLTERRDSRIRSRIALSSWVKGETCVMVTDLTHENKYHILIISVGGIDWKHYKHPLPEQVFNVYMKYWRNVDFTV